MNSVGTIQKQVTGREMGEKRAKDNINLILGRGRSRGRRTPIGVKGSLIAFFQGNPESHTLDIAKGVKEDYAASVKVQL